MKDTSFNNSCYRAFSLKEVADWTLNLIQVKIPKMQRELVWSAIQTEILWDSLIRRIPIGSFVLLENSKLEAKDASTTEKHLLLLDGQQRANGITMGFRPFLPSVVNQGILWLDLIPKIEETKGIRRKFFFKVTNRSHPWGYKATTEDKENMNACVPFYKRQEVSKKILRQNESLKHPTPYELWPCDAGLPIPAYFLISNHDVENYEIFWSDIKKAVENDNSNWKNEYNDKIMDFITSDKDDDKERRQKIYNAFHGIKDIRIFAQIVDETVFTNDDIKDDQVDNSDVSILFERINTQGVKPTNEELIYSLLNTFLPSIYNIEKYANGRMFPYKMANLALKVFLTDQEGKWRSDINIPSLRKCVADKEWLKKFEIFVEETFKTVLEQVDEWLGIGFEEDWQLLKIHRTTIAHYSEPVYQLLLLLALDDGRDKLIPKQVAGLATYLRWFQIKNNDKVSSVIYRIFKRDTGQCLFDKIKFGIAVSFYSNFLLIPLTLENLRKALNEPEIAIPRKTSKVYIQNGFSGHGTELLLYSVRKYMQEYFPDFDPAQRDLWADHNRPWDYDHIIPRNWFRRNEYIKNKERCEALSSSIGNSMPIHFSLNRSKKDSHPSEVFKINDEEERLYLSLDGLNTIERNEDFISDFIAITKDRYFNLYEEWYESLEIAELFTGIDFNEQVDENNNKHPLVKRKKYFDTIASEMSHNTKIYYYDEAQQTDFEALCDIDLAAKWLSIGVVVNKIYLVCICTSCDTWGAGIRKHPHMSNSTDEEIEEWTKTMTFQKQGYEFMVNKFYWHLYKKFKVDEDLLTITKELNFIIGELTKKFPM